MRRLIRLARTWLGDSRGTTLAELMLALTIGAFVITAVLAVMVVMFQVTTSNSTYMAAFRQVQNAGDWITRDALMAQKVYAMKSAVLTSNIDAEDTVIPVDSADGFPESGIILVEDEIIQYEGIDLSQPANPKFSGCVRGTDATVHLDGTVAGFLIAVDWVTWEGDQRWALYDFEEDSRELVRLYFVKEALALETDPYTLERSTVVAEHINPGVTVTWNSEAGELSVDISATVGKYIQGQSGEWESTAVRTYRVTPRPN